MASMPDTVNTEVEVCISEETKRLIEKMHEVSANMERYTAACMCVEYLFDHADQLRCKCSDFQNRIVAHEITCPIGYALENYRRAGG